MAASGTRSILGDEIAFLESGGAGPAVLLIHGNSAAKEVWRKQYESALGKQYRMIAFDLPGHGASSDAAEPARIYRMPGYAEVAAALLAELGIERVAVVGWSLGGHIAIEMIGRVPGLAGFMLSGTPPVSNASAATVAAGFRATATTALFGKEGLSEEEAEELARAAMGYEVPLEPAALAAAKRTDGRARALMFAAFLSGDGADQKQRVEQTTLPTASVNGAVDPLIANDFYDEVAFGNLWEDRVHFIEDVGHAPFWTAPELFNGFLARFLGEVLG